MVRLLSVIYGLDAFFTAAPVVELITSRVFGMVDPVLIVVLSPCCRPLSGCRRKAVADGVALPSIAWV